MVCNLFVDVFKNVFVLLWDYIIFSVVILIIFVVLILIIRMKNNEELGWFFFEIFVEMLEELRILGFSWMKIVELLGVFWWIVVRRVKEYGLGDIEGFDYLLDEGLDKIVSFYIMNYGIVIG